MTLQQLRYVDQVASVGSISEAARKLFVSQPTLTEAVRTLEEELRIILAAGGRRLGVCNGGDMLKPGYREVFMKYCRRPGIGHR